MIGVCAASVAMTTAVEGCDYLSDWTAYSFGIVEDHALVVDMVQV